MCGHVLGVSFEKYELLCKGCWMQGHGVLSMPMLTRAESRARKNGQIHWQAGSWALTMFASVLRRTSSPFSDSLHPLSCPLHLGQLEGQVSSRTFQRNPTGIDLEVLRPTLFTGEMNEEVMIPGLPVTDKAAIILAIILFLLCLVAVVSNGFITAAVGVVATENVVTFYWSAWEPLTSVCSGWWSVRAFMFSCIQRASHTTLYSSS